MFWRMKKTKILPLFMSLVLIAAVLPVACQRQSTKEIVVYTSVDQVFSEPIFREFEKQTGIRVLPVYDVEAAKTTGLVNRIIAEKNHPLADVFWNGEFVQTILLKEDGLLSPYISPNAGDIPAEYVDPQGYWTGFAGRARVLLVNTNLVAPADYPKTMSDLLDDRWPAKQIGIAYPVFGSTATEAAAMYAALGPDAGKAFYQKLHDRGVTVVDGISVIRSMVSGGQLMMGLVDTDDACGAIEDGSPVAMDFLGQADSMGTLIIPNTVAMIKDASHPEEAKQFIDFLLSRDVANSLVKAGWSHIPLRPVDVQSSCMINPDIKRMNISLEDIYKQLSSSQKDLAEIYIK
jgi:iron(III) transport system substrate-binding protein